MALQKRPRTAAMKAVSAETAVDEAEKSKPQDSPLDYLLGVMRDPAVEPERRDEMAKLALPYMHAKPNAAEPSWKDAQPADATELSAIDIARRIAFILTKVALSPSSQDEGRSSEA